MIALRASNLVRGLEAAAAKCASHEFNYVFRAKYSNIEQPKTAEEIIAMNLSLPKAKALEWKAFGFVARRVLIHLQLACAGRRPNPDRSTPGSDRCFRKQHCQRSRFR